MDHILNLEDTNRMLDLDKIALELAEKGDVLDTEIVIRKKIDSGIEVTVYTINFSADGDYQWSTNTKRINLKA